MESPSGLVKGCTSNLCPGRTQHLAPSSIPGQLIGAIILFSCSDQLYVPVHDEDALNLKLCMLVSTELSHK